MYFQQPNNLGGTGFERKNYETMANTKVIFVTEPTGSVIISSINK